MTRLLLTAALAAAASVAIHAAELQARTAAAFDRYVTLSESRMRQQPTFLLVDGRSAAEARAMLDALRRGEPVIERLTTRDGTREVDIPGGIVHHWVGTAFIRGATVNDAVTLLQDYDAHAEIYAPNVERSRILRRDGDRFSVFLRFRMKKVITVVVNSEHAATFSRPASDRAEAWIRSTRIAEVENAGTPQERELPVGNDGGYLWRLNSYWRLLARDGGVYVQCESISLTRSIPTGLGWLVGPYVTSIPRESLTFTLDTTRARLARAAS